MVLEVSLGLPGVSGGPQCCLLDLPQPTGYSVPPQHIETNGAPGHPGPKCARDPGYAAAAEHEGASYRGAACHSVRAGRAACRVDFQRVVLH